MSWIIQKIKKIGILNLCFIAFSLLMLFPFFYAIRYALPYGDDFAMMITTKYSTDSLLMTSLRETIVFYKHHGGNLLPFFLQYFILGFQNFNIFHWVHFILAFFFVFFFASFYLFLKSFFRKFQLNFIWIFMFLFLLVGMNTSSPDETFYAVVCAIAYEFFFSSMILSFACFMNFTESKSNKSYAGALVWGILGANILPFAGILNLVYFSSIIYIYIYYKRIDKKTLILFLAVFVMALIVAVAPGNFERHEFQNSSAGMNLIKCLVSTGLIIGKYAFYLFKNSFLVFGAAGLFFISLVSTRTYTKRIFFYNPLFLALFLFVMCYLYVFPVCLGYGGSLHLPERICFFSDFVMTFSVFVFAIHSGIWLRNKYHPVFTRNQIPFVILFFTIFLAVEVQNVRLKNKYTLKCIKEIYTGNMEEFYEVSKDILIQIQDSKEADVVVHSKKLHSDILQKLGLDAEDNSYWVNEAVATLYGKNSVTYIIDSEN